MKTCEYCGGRGFHTVFNTARHAPSLNLTCTGCEGRGYVQEPPAPRAKQYVTVPMPPLSDDGAVVAALNATGQNGWRLVCFLPSGDALFEYEAS